MRPTLKLGELIASHMTAPGHVKKSRPEADFIMSGIRAASGANNTIRDRILSDVSDVIGCHPRDLNFLFADFADSMSESAQFDVAVPDYRDMLLSAAE